MGLKIKHSEVVTVRAERIKAYLLSKALRGLGCTDTEIKQIYHLSDDDFDEAAETLLQQGVVEKK